MNLQAHLLARLKDLSPAHRRVADYALEHGNRVALMTANELADALGVSAATIVRASQAIGYTGYPQMREELADALRAQFDSVSRLRMAQEEDVAGSTERWIDAYGEELAHVVEDLRHEEILAAAKTIHSNDSGRIIILGYRGTVQVAELLALRLNVFKPNIDALDAGSGTLPDRFLHVSEQDILVVMSHARYEGVLARVVERVKPLFGTVIVLTENLLSLPSQYADMRISVPRIHPPEHSPVALFSPLVIACEVLVAVTADLARDVIEEAYERGESLWREFETYPRS